MANMITLPYSLDSFSARDFSVRSQGAEAGFRAVSWEGPAEAGRIYDSRGFARGLFLKAPWSEAPDWLGDVAEIAELIMLPEFRLDLAFSKTRDPQTGLTLWALDSLDAKDLFGLRLGVTLAGLDQALADRLATFTTNEAADPAKLIQLAGSIEVRGLGITGIKLSYTDDSFAYRFASSLAGSRTSMKEVADDLEAIAAELGSEIGGTVNPAFIRNMRAVLAKPGPFTLEWRPEHPVTVGFMSNNALENETGWEAGLAKLYLSVGGGPESALFD
jgi:hypothetical protein